MQQVETSNAIITRMGPDLVVCRYKTDAKVSSFSAQENLQARLALPGAAPQAVLTVFPAGVEFDLSLFDRDQYRSTEVVDRTRALAFVAGCNTMKAIMDLYFAYYPAHVARQVFTNEGEALAWVERARLN